MILRAHTSSSSTAARLWYDAKRPTATLRAVCCCRAAWTTAPHRAGAVTRPAWLTLHVHDHIPEVKHVAHVGEEALGGDVGVHVVLQAAWPQTPPVQSSIADIMSQGNKQPAAPSLTLRGTQRCCCRAADTMQLQPLPNATPRNGLGQHRGQPLGGRTIRCGDSAGATASCSLASPVAGMRTYAPVQPGTSRCR